MKENVALMNTSTDDTYNIKELQNAILQIAQYIHDFCIENEIEYCLMGGSALGAKRHGGFIPWDDDLDIFMTAQGYEKFRATFLEKGDKERFYLQEQGVIKGRVRKPKLRMNDTTYIEDGIENLKMHHGIFVDIFILHNCPDNKVLQLWQCAWSKYIVIKSLSNQHYKKRTGYIQILLRFLRLFPAHFLINRAYKELYRYDYKETKLCCNFIGKAIYKSGIYEKADLWPAKPVAFETIELLVPGKVESFLTKRFGDYMKIPSKDKIRYDQHAKIWSTKESFTNYVNEDSNYQDEKVLI